MGSIPTRLSYAGWTDESIEEARRQIRLAWSFELAMLKLRHHLKDRAQRLKTEYSNWLGKAALPDVSGLTEMKSPNAFDGWFGGWRERRIEGTPPKWSVSQQLAVWAEDRVSYNAAQASNCWLYLAMALRAWRRFERDWLASMSSELIECGTRLQAECSNLLQKLKQSQSRAQDFSWVTGYVPKERSRPLDKLEATIEDAAWGRFLELRDCLQTVTSCMDDPSLFAWPVTACQPFLDHAASVDEFVATFEREVKTLASRAMGSESFKSHCVFVAALLRASEERCGDSLDPRIREKYEALLTRMFRNRARVIALPVLGEKHPENPTAVPLRESRIDPKIADNRLDRHGVEIDDDDTRFVLPARVSMPPTQPRVMSVLRACHQVATNSGHLQLKSDIAALFNIIEQSRAPSLRVWWSRLNSRELQLKAAELVYTVVLGVAIAASSPEWKMCDSALKKTLTEEGVFKWRCRRNDEGTIQPFENCFVSFQPNVDVESEFRAGVSGLGPAFLWAEGLGELAPLAAIVVPESPSSGKAYPPVLSNCRVQLNFLQRADPSWQGWPSFEAEMRTLRHPRNQLNATESRSVQLMFWSLHPRAVPKLYGLDAAPNLDSNEYKRVVQELLAVAGQVELPVDPETLWIGSIKKRPGQIAIEWNFDVKAAKGTVLRAKFQPGGAPSSLVLAFGEPGSSLNSLERTFVEIPPLSMIGSVGVPALENWNQTRDALPWRSDDEQKKFANTAIAKLKEWTGTADGLSWLNQLAKIALRDASAPEFAAFRKLFSLLKIMPNLTAEGSIEWPPGAAVPPQVGLEPSALPPGRSIVDHPVTFATDATQVQGRFSIGIPRDGSAYHVLQELAKLAADTGSVAVQTSVDQALRRTAEQVMKGVETPLGLTRDDVVNVLGELSRHDPQAGANAASLQSFFTAFVRASTASGWMIEPRSWAFDECMSLEEFRLKYPSVRAEHRYGPLGEEKRVQIVSFGLRSAAGQVIQEPHAVVLVGPRPAGLDEFQSLLGRVQGDAASSVLNYLASDDWFHGLVDRSYLTLKTTRLFHSFFRALGRDYRLHDRKSFDSLLTALKVVLNDPQLNLRLFQERPGRLEQDIGWYEAEPVRHFHQSSEVEAVIQPGLMTADGRRQLKAIVSFKN